MQWLLDNWLLLLLGVGMIAMHLFGHGGHGDKGDKGDKGVKPATEKDTARAVIERTTDRDR